MSAPAKKRTYLDPVKEAEAAKALVESLGTALNDDEVTLDMIEGETSLLEALDVVLETIRDAEVIIRGVDAVVEVLEARKARAKATKERCRALIEQALSIADVDTIPRPTATLTLSQRKPTVSVTEESDIPARFWKAGAPVLDKVALNEAVAAHAAALLIEDEAERRKALSEAPPIPGAVLSNGAPSLSIRTK